MSKVDIATWNATRNATRNATYNATWNDIEKVVKIYRDQECSIKLNF